MNYKHLKFSALHQTRFPVSGESSIKHHNDNQRVTVHKEILLPTVSLLYVYLQVMKRVLIITYYWPPIGGSGVQRWVKFAKYLPAEGWQPVIYTPENPDLSSVDTSLLNDIPEEAEIIRTRILEPYGIYRKLTGSKGQIKVEANPGNGGKGSLLKKISMWIRGNFFMPDPRCFWINPSVRFLKKYLKEHPVDMIISTGPPQSMHLIARKVALATGIPWVADFRDPWTKIFYFKHLRLGKWAERRHHELEQSVLDDATAVVAVSPLVQKDFAEMTKTPVHLVTNGYDESDYTDPVETDGNFNIVHTGLLTTDGNPVELWKVLGEKCRANREFSERFRLILAGKTDPSVLKSIRDAGLEAYMTDLGYIDHDKAVQQQRQASVLILPIREEPETKAILPGKLFEYLAARRPILGVGTREGAMAAVLQETGAGKIFDWKDTADIKEYIDKCWTDFCSGELMTEASDIERFSRRSTTRKMVELFEGLIKN